MQKDTSDIKFKSNEAGQKIKQFVFGVNNERLEYFLDYYYKLSPEQRTIVNVTSLLATLFAIIITIVLYISAMNQLQERLEVAFSAANELNNLKSQFQATSAEYEDLEKQLRQASEGLMLISAIDQKAKEMGIELSGLSPQIQTKEIPETNPLSKEFDKSYVEFKVSNLSLKSLISFSTALEKLPYMLTISKLEIQQIFNTKLFFDVTIGVEGFVNKQKSSLKY